MRQTKSNNQAFIYLMWYCKQEAKSGANSLVYHFPPWNGTGQGWEALNKSLLPLYDLWAGDKERQKGRSEKVMRQSEVLQPRPLISRSQWRCKKCLNWSSLWEGLQMEMLGLGMQICLWAWLAQSGQPESVTVTVSGKLQCSDCAPSLVWGEQLLPMRPAEQSLVVAYGQAWKINTGF